MGLNKEERKQLANSLHNYVGKTHPDWQTRRHTAQEIEVRRET